MPDIHDSAQIHGVQTVDLRVFGDERGQFMEFFRKEWFPQREWGNVQLNRSESSANVLRGLHFHRHQVDYWHVLQGHIRAVLADLRPHSPTYQQTQIVELHGKQPSGLYIPIGVAHGFVSVTNCMLIYTVDNYYDSSDEYGVHWNDPTLNVNWGVAQPVLSARDEQNPLFTELEHPWLSKVEL